MASQTIVFYVIVLIASLISIAFGVNSLYHFYKAFSEKRNMMKYFGDLVGGFFLIFVMPLVIYFLGYAMMSMGPDASFGIGFIVDTSGVSGNGRLMASYPSESSVIELKIQNQFDEQKEMNLVITCLDDKSKCNDVVDLLMPEQDSFTVGPGLYFKLPIKITAKKGVPEGKYQFNVTVRNKDGSEYATMPIAISIE